MIEWMSAEYTKAAPNYPQTINPLIDLDENLILFDEDNILDILILISVALDDALFRKPRRIQHCGSNPGNGPLTTAARLPPQPVHHLSVYRSSSPEIYVAREPGVEMGSVIER